MTTFDAHCFFGAVAGKMRTQLVERHRAGSMPLFFLAGYARLVRTRNAETVMSLQSLARNALIDHRCPEQYNAQAVEVMLSTIEQMLTDLVEELATGGAARL